MTKHVRVRYFAVLREERGRDVDELDTSVHTSGELYDALEAKYGFSLPRHLVGVAVNGRLVTRETVLNDGDEVVFLPPVAGG
ncbi:MAG: MoaD/ThiS family protein [Fimbriimonadia bacterium]